MACPTCDCTMRNIGMSDRGDSFFLCPRCGTVKMDAFGQHGDKVYVPTLVERCRTFLNALRNYPQQGVMFMAGIESVFQTHGIAESINLPAERK